MLYPFSTKKYVIEYLCVQSIKQDVMGHEEALARIIAIVGKLTKDENVSETEKMNVKAEMSRLQEKWNRAQNNVHLKYLRYATR